MSSVAELLAELQRRRSTNKLDYYTPYEFQKKFHNAVGFETGKPAAQKILMAGNGTGKTLCGGMETAIHLTGNYPDWWGGQRFTSPVVWMVGGVTNEAVRDINQKILFGDPTNPQALGTGTVPLHLIGKRTMKPGVPNAYDSVMVRHKFGWSKVMLRAYEQGAKKHMGHRIHGGWLDEEPPQDIWSQYLRATISMKGILYITFTPESGLTEVVNSFMNDLKPGQALIPASWEDADHLVHNGELTDEAKQLESSFRPHEREMRRRGIPVFGTGLVFPFAEEDFVIDPIQIPKHWPRINGIDFGWDHPFGAAAIAWDRDSDVVYIYADYRSTRETPPVHAEAMKAWGAWIPVSWPHDGLQHEKGTGDELRKKYADLGLNMLYEKATNPPDFSQGQKEGEGGNSPEAGLLEMYQRLQQGRLKVFRTCTSWLEERRTYHRDENGKLVKLRDDVISASRHAIMMLRHARVETVRKPKMTAFAGATNW